MATLYDEFKAASIWSGISEVDMDIPDEDYDNLVTVCIDLEDEYKDYYYRFCVGLLRFVDCRIDWKDDTPYVIYANWSGMIEKNIEVFEEVFFETPRDDLEDFIDKTITEIHYWYAGYNSEANYKYFVEKFMPRLEV